MPWDWDIGGEHGGCARNRCQAPPDLPPVRKESGSRGEQSLYGVFRAPRRPATVVLRQEDDDYVRGVWRSLVTSVRADVSV